MLLTYFPSRVWEPVGFDEHGRQLWASRTADYDDHRRRREYLERVKPELFMEESMENSSEQNKATS